MPSLTSHVYRFRVLSPMDWLTVVYKLHKTITWSLVIIGISLFFLSDLISMKKKKSKLDGTHPRCPAVTSLSSHHNTKENRKRVGRLESDVTLLEARLPSTSCCGTYLNYLSKFVLRLVKLTISYDNSARL